MGLYCFCLQNKAAAPWWFGLKRETEVSSCLISIFIFVFLDEKLHVCAATCSITVNTAIVELIYKFYWCCCLSFIYCAFVKFFEFITNFIASLYCFAWPVLCVFNFFYLKTCISVLLHGLCIVLPMSTLFKM